MPNKQALEKQVLDIYQNHNFLSGFINGLPNPSLIMQVLYNEGIHPSTVYREMLHDSQIISDVQAMRGYLDLYETEITTTGTSAEEKRALELCQSIFKEDQTEVNWYFYQTCLFGYRLVEEIYRFDNGDYIPNKFIPIPNEYVSIDFWGNPLLHTQSNQNGIDIQNTPKYKNKFVFTKYFSDDINPYGLPLLDACYWYWLFKKDGVKSLALHVENFGNPPIYARNISSGITDEEINAVIANLHLYGSGVFPEGVEIQHLEIQNPSDSNNSFVAFLDRAISKILTSQAQVSEQTTGTGSMASSKVAEKRSEHIYAMRRDMVSRSWNKVFKNLIEVNFPKELHDKITVPNHKFIIEGEPRLGWAQMFTEISKQESSIQVESEFYYNKLRIPKPKQASEIILLGGQSVATTTPTEPPQELSFATTDNESKLEKLANEGADEYAKELEKDRIKEIEEKLKQAKTTKDFRSALEEMYEKSNVSKKKALK